MGRKPRVDRSPEEKWQIVQEGIKSGNVSETCRRHGIAPNLFYRWKDEAEQGAKAALGGRSAAAAETEKDHGIRQPERTLGRKSLEIEILKQFLGSRRLDMVLDYLSDPDEFRDFEMQRIERLPVGVVRPRKV
jgi:transposase-like protein